MLRFEHINYLTGLFALIALGGLFAFALFMKKRTVKKIGDERLVRELTRKYSPFNFLFKFLLIAVCLTAIIFGAANLQMPGAEDAVSRKGIDVVIAMDVSRSMLADDIKPNRLERARQLVYKLIDKFPDDRIGLVVFAGHAYLQMPLTTDHAAARMYVQQANPSIVAAQGTVISEALRVSNRAFNSKDRKFKSIILITDGEDHDEQAIPMAQQIAGEGVMINTVGIGSPEGSPILDPSTNDFKKDANGNTVISKLNEPELQQLAANTNGIYVRLSEPDDAVTALDTQLDKIEKTATGDNSLREYTSYFQWFIALALLFLIGEFFYPERSFKTA
ncbi:Ca-activated chloride channel family protein [Pseudobacter ginsenosidimutans]|uniref:Ca-activated chloride channel family protein n=2 Tax=Pseudobacter ginsenosidimutans TaxID=661488 RepID=A0A4Q7MVV8_9BACT|nr:Ca-activated chloride channel family protein [Pseudobacter ginsenosidimutans]